jgi:hypothetical protein
LATYFPLPILFESRRRHIQRFLVLTGLSISLIWFPIILTIIHQQIPCNFPLIIALDRTQWQENNVFMISLIYSRRALPIYWTILNKKGASNLQEQKALIRPVIKLLNKYHIMIIGDREFHWYILTSLENEIEVIKIYEQRMGIEMMFKDYKTGGYNLEGSKANIQRLTYDLKDNHLDFENKALSVKIVDSTDVKNLQG